MPNTEYAICLLFTIQIQNLMEINISWCNLVTENGVEAIARGCNKVTKFICKGCKQVNDRAVKSLALFCPGIEVLNLQSCSVR